MRNRGRVGNGFLADGAVVVEVDGAPGAGDAAAAGGVEFGAFGEIEIDGVEDADGEGVGLGIHGGGLALLGVGGELGGFRGGTFRGGIGMESGDLGGAGQGHRNVSGSFRGGAGGLAGGDLGSGGEDGGNGAEVGQRAGGEVAHSRREGWSLQFRRVNPDGGMPIDAGLNAFLMGSLPGIFELEIPRHAGYFPQQLG